MRERERDGVITSTTCHGKIFECLIPRERLRERLREKVGGGGIIKQSER